MPRQGERRVPAATKVTEDDYAELEALADAAGVSRADVLRAGVVFALRGVNRAQLVEYLREVGRESPSGALTPEQWVALGGRSMRLRCDLHDRVETMGINVDDAGNLLCYCEVTEQLAQGNRVPEA